MHLHKLQTLLRVITERKRCWLSNYNPSAVSQLGRNFPCEVTNSLRVKKEPLRFLLLSWLFFVYLFLLFFPWFCLFVTDSAEKYERHYHQPLSVALGPANCIPTRETRTSYYNNKSYIALHPVKIHVFAVLYIININITST